MAWARRNKPAAEPVRTQVPALPDRTSTQDRYCTTCEDWYPPSQSKEHEH